MTAAERPRGLRRRSLRLRRRRPAAARAAIRGVLLLQLAANGTGAVLVLTYLKWLFPVELPEGGPAENINIAVFTLYLAVTVFLAVPVNAMFLRHAMAWVREGREPTPRERRDTLSQPFRQTVSAFVGWFGAAVIFGLLNDDAVRVSVGITLAGLVTCSMLYLLLERHFRPIYALALTDAELPERRREILPRLMLAWLLGSAIPLTALGLAPIAVPEEQRNLGWQLTVLVVTVILAGGLVMRAAARSVADPINRVRDALRDVEGGDLEVDVPVDDIGEIGRLSAGFNSMVHGLRERAELFDLLDHQVGPEVARHSFEERPSLGGGRRVVTVLFVDLHGYTSYSESHTPEQVVAMLNRFFGVVVEVVTDAGGHVNKFEGDAALCVFGAPDDQPDHAARALRAAATLPLVLAGLPEGPTAGIGVATGEAVAGYVGTTDRYEYTVIGDVVNVAARLTDFAKGHASGVLAAEETITAAGVHASVWRPVGPVRVRGRSSETVVHEPMLDLTPGPAGPAGGR